MSDYSKSQKKKFKAIFIFSVLVGVCAAYGTFVGFSYLHGNPAFLGGSNSPGYLMLPIFGSIYTTTGMFGMLAFVLCFTRLLKVIPNDSASDKVKRL